MQGQLPGAEAPRRHPSAGNLGRRPALVAPADEPIEAPAPSAAQQREVELGPGVTDDAATRLVGNTEGKRVLDLGCGNGGNAIAMARAGAKVIAVDSSVERLSAARRAADEAGVRIEFHHGDIADLPFVRADQIDLAIAVGSLGDVADIARVFRQVHRVLRTEAPFVISVAHPWALVTDRSAPPRLERSAFDAAPLAGNDGAPVHPHRVTDLITELVRSNFRPDAVLEPPSNLTDPRAPWIPLTLIVRGRKQGI